MAAILGVREDVYFSSPPHPPLSHVDTKRRITLPNRGEYAGIISKRKKRRMDKKMEDNGGSSGGGAKKNKRKRASE